jgi:hypothetical protein
MKLKKFWILWTFVANYSDKLIQVDALDADSACRIALGSYSPELTKATVYVFDTAPALVMRKGVEVTPHRCASFTDLGKGPVCNECGEVR